MINRKNTDLWIEESRRECLVKIYIRQHNGNKSDLIHSLGVDGIAQCTTVEGCSYGEMKPYITMPMDVFNTIKAELFSDNERRLNEDILKLRGEVTAKDEHIKNLNEIFDKTLNKIK